MRSVACARRLAISALAASLALGLGSAAVLGQAIPLDLEVGYRFVDVSGNEQMYRTQINDRQGLLLRSFNFTSSEPLGGGLLDYFHVDASDIGAGPAGQLRLQAGAQDLYKLTFTWRETDFYSALPAFANPFLAEGIIPGQQTYNRTRNIYDATLELLPGKIISPILQFTRNTYNGPGTTTYHLGGNDFQLNDQVHSTDDLYRVGLQFQYGPVQGAVTQGWRYFRWTQTNSLAPGAGDGNVTTPILGQEVTADAIESVEENKVNTPVTNAWVTGNLFGRLKLIGSYMKADGSSQTNYVEADAGNFVGFEIARFFAGLGEEIQSRARTDYWRGSARAEFDINACFRLSGGWVERSRTLTGQALISSLYLNTVTFAGVPAGDLPREIDARTAVEQDDVTWDANLTATMLGPFSFNAGWSQLQQDVLATPDATEIIEPGGQGGQFDRTVNTFGGGASFSMWGLTLTADYRHDDANQPIFRTDFLDRDRYKFRGLWTWKDFLKVGAVFTETHAEDDIVEIGYSTKIREFVADVEVSLLQNMLTLRGAGGEFATNREILIRIPENFDIVPTKQKEFGHTWEGGVRFAWNDFSVDAAYLWMNNNGSIPFTVERFRVLADYFFLKNLGVTFEWLDDKYSERPAFDQAGPLADYNGNRYYFGLHWRP
jgi:hypothetical protein